MNGARAQRNNPYIIGRPIKEREEDRFFGRESLFLFIEDNLKQNVRVILLHGQRRIGKSSVLKQISNFVVQDGFVFVSFDLQNKAQLSLNQILYELAQGIVEQFELENRIESPTLADLEGKPDRFSHQFLPNVYQALGEKNLVLLLDEFDVLHDSNIIDKGWGFFRYLERLLRQHGKLFLIPVVGRDLGDMPALLGLFGRPPTQEIGFLDELSAKRLITQPVRGLLEYEQEALQAILKLSAGHPYFTQVICWTLFQRARQQQNWQVTRDDVESIVDEAIHHAEGGLAWFWDGLPISERVILSAVAESQRRAIETEQWVPEEPLTLLKKHGVVQTEPLVQAVNRLADKGFLDDIRFRVKVELVRCWLVQRHPLQREIEELENVEQSEETNRLYEVATELYRQGKKPNALALYEQVLALNPNHFSTLLKLAEGYLEVEEFKRAVELYTRAYKVNPIQNKERLLQALETYGHKLFTQQEFEQAKQQYNQVLKIEPTRTSAQHRLREIETVLESREIRTIELGNRTWTCEGYRDVPHPPRVVPENQRCPKCDRSIDSSEYSSQYGRKRSLSVGMAVAAGIIALMSVGIFYQQSISCKVGEQKVLFRCTPLPRESRGERTLFPSMGNTDRDRGIEAFRRGKYTEAAPFFKKAVVAARNDPEVLIYYNNALALQKGNPFTLAVVVPVDNDAPTAQEMLRGVAQAQNHFNSSGGLNNRLLEIVIANDGNKPEKSQQVAQELIEDNSILAVIGHNSSDATRAALAEYEKAGVALISPTSTGISLTGDNFFRTVPSDAASGEKLADYAKNSLDVSKVVIFYNPGSVYSTSLREAFIKNFEKLRGEIVRDIDLSNPNFNAELEVPRSVFRYQAQAALLFPDKKYTSVALEIAQANAELLVSPSNQQKRGLKLLGGDALYSQTTLNAGGTAVESMILAIPWFAGTPQSQPFSQAAARQWGGQVSWRTATSFDATQALIAALSPDASRATVLRRLPEVNLSTNDTSGDALQFAPDQELDREPMLVRVNGGKFELAGE